MKLPINETKLTGLWARNCATIPHFLILKFAFVPEKFPGLSRNEPIFAMQRVTPSLFLSLPLSLFDLDLVLCCELFWNFHGYFAEIGIFSFFRGQTKSRRTFGRKYVSSVSIVFNGENRSDDLSLVQQKKKYISYLVCTIHA